MPQATFMCLALETANPLHLRLRPGSDFQYMNGFLVGLAQGGKYYLHNHVSLEGVSRLWAVSHVQGSHHHEAVSASMFDLGESSVADLGCVVVFSFSSSCCLRFSLFAQLRCLWSAGFGAPNGQSDVFRVASLRFRGCHSGLQDLGSMKKSRRFMRLYLSTHTHTHAHAHVAF